jgi:ParB-like chromosome segregation protein Spo0J
MPTESDCAILRIDDAAPGQSNGGLDALLAVERVGERNVPVDSLIPGFYLRKAGTDAAHVQLLADAADSIKLPPILVQKSTSRIVDGMHRFEAAKLHGSKEINACIIDCSDEEAFILAVKSNTLHGLPLSKADRIFGAKRILSANPDWSDRAVAEVTGLSAKTVGILRNRSADEIPILRKRVGRDGKRRPVSAAEGRRRAADYINAHPDAPLRRVAVEADVSLGTAHDVRERIRRGVDPVLERRRSLPVRPDALPEHGPQAGALPEQAVCGSATPELYGRLSSANTSIIRAAHPDSLSRRNAKDRDNSRQLTWPAISAKLAGDPALRYTEGGRAFLRWMATRAAQVEEWREFIDAIPVHWLRDVSQIASDVSEEWRQFAIYLRNKTREPAS